MHPCKSAKLTSHPNFNVTALFMYMRVTKFILKTKRRVKTILHLLFLIEFPDRSIKCMKNIFYFPEIKSTQILLFPVGEVVEFLSIHKKWFLTTHICLHSTLLCT